MDLMANGRRWTTRRRARLALACAGLLAGGCLTWPAVRERTAGPVSCPLARGHYLVVSTASTAGQPAWRAVADRLRARHDADLALLPDGLPESLLPTLRRVRPRYVCFVLRPEEAGRDTVVRLHRVMRQVDDDPYEDAIWSILTGFEAADALRVAEHEAPLRIASGYSSMGPGLAEGLGCGFASSETDAQAFWRVDRQHGVQPVRVAPDPTAALVDAFARQPPQVMHTSGHATEHDWQIGYTVRAGELRHQDGRLYACGVDGVRRELVSPEPKVYLPMGNCLIGHVSGRDCMATAWMHSGGVLQMYGYTVVTFCGYMGWGVNACFGDGRLTLPQAVHANRQALLHTLQSRFPEQAGLGLESYDPAHINDQAARLGIDNSDLLGLLWDRDTVACYGDPAWDARMPFAPAWDAAMECRSCGGGTNAYTVTLTARAAGNWPDRPLWLPLAERVRSPRLVETVGVSAAVVADDFVLVPVKGARATGDTVRIRFEAVPEPSPATRARLGAIDLSTLPVDAQGVSAGLPEALQESLSRALLLSGEHRPVLLKALRDVSASARPALAFLIAHLPEPDLQTLDAGILRTQAEGAWNAWQAAPWRGDVSEPLFLETILPLANVDERREAWLPVLREAALPLVRACRTPGEAAIALNAGLFERVGVRYHATLRPKPSQSPAESMAAGYASCTGLSILLADACRSVGIPARLAGVPQWTGVPGNHTWVEIWDAGTWHPVGAAEPGPLGQVWFKDQAARADATHPLTRIYVCRFGRGATIFPLAWNPGYRFVEADDVTPTYRQGSAPAGSP